MDDLFRWAIGLVMTLLGFNAVRTINKQDALETRLNDHEKHVRDTYAKDTTVQTSLGRIHDRIDDIASDIKTLIGKVKSK